MCSTADLPVTLPAVSYSGFANDADAPTPLGRPADSFNGLPVAIASHGLHVVNVVSISSSLSSCHAGLRKPGSLSQAVGSAARLSGQSIKGN